MEEGRVRASSAKRLAIALILIGIILVSGVAYLYYTPPKVGELGLIGVVSVEGPILNSEDADLITAALSRAVFNTSVKAVVLKIDSPGGFADLVEQIYLDVLELEKEKPVVALTVTALSGGYYIAVAAEHIMAHPTSAVGNVGVMGVGPPTLIPSESTLETGPYKVTGFSKLLFPFNLTRALESFAGAVEKGRGSRLKLSPTELRRGMVYLGSEALAAGLVDEMGSLQRAIRRAADEAGLKEYGVVDLIAAQNATGLLGSQANGARVAWRDITVEVLNRLNPPPALYFLYLPAQAYPQNQYAEFQREANETLGAGGFPSNGTVIVDLSHGNLVSEWELDILAAELAKRGMTLVFDDDWSSVELALNNASGLIVAAPTRNYSSDEVDKVEKFVAKGRVLLLLFDPSAEYLRIPALFGPINSIANPFGLSFAKGYLYNLDEYYGFYRNIYVRRFGNSSLTRGLNGIVLFTATHVYSEGRGAAYASSETFSSTAEQKGSYSPIATVEGKGKVVAIGDLTFMMEPYCYVEDNYRLILNIISDLTEVKIVS